MKNQLFDLIAVCCFVALAFIAMLANDNYGMAACMLLLALLFKPVQHDD